MPLTVKQLHTKDQTAAEMYRLVDRYAGDLNDFDVNGTPLSRVTLPAFYSAIRSIPYREDTTGIEVVTRPYLMLTAPDRGWDCKKKAIAIASWLKLHGTRYRFAAVSRRANREIHHVIVQAFIDGEWVDIDATYPHNQLFEREQWTKIEPLGGSGRAVDRAVLVSMSGDGPARPALTYDYIAKMRQLDPAFMGDGGLTAGGIATIIVAAIAAAASITVAIVSGVQQRKDREQRAKTEAASISSYEDIQMAAIQGGTEQAAIIAQQEAARAELIKKWILPAGIAAGALLLLR